MCFNHLYLVGWASVGTTERAVGRWWANLHYCLGVRVCVCMILFFFSKRSFMYIHWYYCVLQSIPLMYFTEYLYVILSSRIYFEFYVYLWDIPRCVACWFYVFLCTLSEMTNKTCTIIIWYWIRRYCYMSVNSMIAGLHLFSDHHKITIIKKCTQFTNTSSQPPPNIPGK